MSATDKLIVALDGNAVAMGEIFLRLYHNTPIRWFKVSPDLLLQYSGMIFIENMIREGHSNADAINLMYDGKIYDTRDTVERTVRRAFSLGARFVTVHATPSVMEAAMRAKPADERCKVLAVSHMTDNPVAFSSSELRYALTICDGAICSFKMAKYTRQWLNDNKPTIVTPGIRPDWHAAVDNHWAYTSPTEALQAGADYLVVGRPIIQAPDPVAAARAIIAEMEEASV